MQAWQGEARRRSWVGSRVQVARGEDDGRRRGWRGAWIWPDFRFGLKLEFCDSNVHFAPYNVHGLGRSACRNNNCPHVDFSARFEAGVGGGRRSCRRRRRCCCCRQRRRDQRRGEQAGTFACRVTCSHVRLVFTIQRIHFIRC